MKAWLIWRVAIADDSWVTYGGLAEVVGVAFDEESAHEIANRRTIEFARANPRTFARLHSDQLEELRGGTEADDTLTTYTDEELCEAADEKHHRPFCVDEVELAELVDVSTLRAADLADVVRGLGDLVSTLNEDAGRALVESASSAHKAKRAP